MSSLAVVSYAAVRGLLVLRQQRGFRDFENSEFNFGSLSRFHSDSLQARVSKYDSICGFLFMGWALHYFPFYLMKRQLFLHHYFPALYYSILMCAVVFDLTTSSLRPRIRLYIAAGLVALAIWAYAYFSPLAYAGPWTRAQCEKAKWLKTWDFACNDFPVEAGGYGTTGNGQPATSAVPVAGSVVGGEEGGRAAVVVDPKVAGNVVPPPKEETTRGQGAVAEPGVDVFADGADANEGASSGIQQQKQQQVPVADKEISTVASPPEAETTKESEKVTEEKSKSSPAVDLDAAVEGMDPVLERPPVVDDKKAEKAETTTSTSEVKQATTEDKVEHKQEGPLEVDALEAEIARNDLFAEDN